MNKNKNRIVSYIFAGTFILSLVLISITSLKLIENYRENQRLTEIMEKIEDDYNKIVEDNGYINIENDEDVDIKVGKIVIMFPNVVE